MNNEDARHIRLILSENEGRYDNWPAFREGVDKENDSGLAGVLRKALKYHNAYRNMPNFQALCDADKTYEPKSFLIHIGKRLAQLREIQGLQLEAFALFLMVTRDEEEFESALREAQALRNMHAMYLQDLVSDIIDRALVPKEDGSPIEIFGMTFTYQHDPIEVRVISRASDLWEQAGKPKDSYEVFLEQAKGEFIERIRNTRRGVVV